MSVDNSSQTTHFNPASFSLRKNAVISNIKEYTELKGLKPEDVRVLDFGCGNGLMTSELLQIGYKVVAVDVDVGQVERARERNPGAEVIQSSVYDFKGELEGYDVVVSLEVVEHLYDPAKYIKLCRGFLKQGGVLMLTTPYYGYVKNLLIALTGKWDSHHMPLVVHGHIKLFSIKLLEEMLSNEGFDNCKIKTLGRLSFMAMMSFAVCTK